MGSACSTFPGGCPSPKFLTRHIKKKKNQIGGMHFALFSTVYLVKKKLILFCCPAFKSPKGKNGFCCCSSLPSRLKASEPVEKNK